MPQALATFIDNALSIADKRNLAKENPVVVTIPVENAENIIVVVSHLEPNHVTLPFNVTWIVADPASPDYRRALRRVSALAYGGYRNTWATLTTYQDILDEPQFYDRTATFQLGEVQTTGVQPATEEVRGIFRLLDAATDPQDPVVVGDNDPRMSDARPPQPHAHPLLPATMLQGSVGINDFFVTIEDSNPPQQGQILAITGPGTQPNEYIGIWRNVTQADIEYDGPTFDSLTIEGPGAPVEELQPVVFRANAHFSDGSTENNVPATWSIIANGTAATISPTTGTLNSTDVNGDQVVRVQARYTHPESGQEQIQTFDLTILDVTVAKVLVSIAIQGPSDVNENTQASYSVVATYDDSSTSGVVPDTFTSSNPGAGTFDGNTGVLTVPELLADQSTTLSASYTENGVSRSATLNVNTHDLTVYPQSAVINGPTSVAEGTTATYTMTVTFTDLSSQVVAISNWASSNAAAGTINSATGVFTAPAELGADEATTISASYSNNGRTVSATLEVTALDTTNYPVSAEIISGPDDIDEGGNTATYQLEVTFTDSTTAIVAVSNWTSSDTGLATIDSVSGVLTTAADVKPSGTTTISASYTQHGTTVSATKDVVVNDTTNYPVSAVIVGSGTMNEGETQNLILRVTYLDNSIADVTTDNWSSSNSSIASVNAATGAVQAAANVVGNQNVQISCSYEEHGETVTPTPFSINVVDTTVYPVSATIEGLSTVSEGVTTTYQLRVVFDDGSNSIQATDDWAIDNVAAGTINASTGVFNAQPGLTSDVNATITASYTVDGNTASASLPITVTDDTVYPASAVINGPTTVDENTTATYTMTVTFTDATSSTVTVSDWAVDNTSAAGINSNTGLLTALEVNGNQAVNVTASYTDEGVTVNASLAITVSDLTIYPVSAAIIGLGTVTEGGTTTYQLQVTYDDSSTVVVSPTDWASDNLSVATINATTGALQAAANVIGNQTVNISASFTEHGTTVSDTREITVSDTTAYPVSAVIQGPTSVDESTSATYTLEVTFSDSSVSTVTVNNWASSVPAAGNINANTGVFVAASNSTKADITTSISCSYTLDGTTVTPTPVTVSVVDTTAYPVSARIVGNAAVNEGTGPHNYVFEVTYSDSSIANETISDWASSNVTAGTINATTGEFTPAADLPADEVTTLSGSFTEHGDTVSATLDVTVTDATNYPQSLSVIGPLVLNESAGTATYTAQVTYLDSSTATVSVTDWAMTGNAADVGTINATTGELTLPADVIGNQSSTLTCSYTENGVTVNASQAITIVDDVVKPVSAAITGAASIDEGNNTETYVLTVTYDDGSSGAVAVSDWASDNATAGTIGAADGIFTSAADVSSDQVTNLTASYTEHGITVNDSFAITVVDTTNYPASAQILGAASMDEGDSATYQLQVTYQDSSTSVVSVTDWASSNATAGSIAPTTGVFTAAADVTGNQPTTLTASYTENGVTVNGSRVINVLDTTNLPVSVAITGPASINEEESGNYTATVTYQDSSTIDQTVNVLGAWSRSNAAAGNIGTNTGQFDAASVASDETTDITFTFTQHGQTVNDTINISVIDIYPVSLAITGPATAQEGGSNVNLTATVTNNDSSTEDVTTSAIWGSSNVSVATVGTSSGVVNPSNNIVGDQPVTINASYSSDGQTVNATHNMTIQEAILRPVSVAITGPASVDEGGNTINLVATVTYDDSSTAVVTTTGTWSSANASIASVGTSSGVVTSGNDIVGDQTVDINFEYTENGVTVNATPHSLTVNDVILRPVSVAITGPTTVAEGTNTINLVATVTYDDSSTAVVTTSANGTWSSDNTAAATIGANDGIVTSSNDIVGDQSANINYEYTENGTTVNATAHAITVTEAINRPASLAVSGPASVAEGGNTIALSAILTREDSSTAAVASSVDTVWSSSNTAIATVDAVGNVTSANDIVGDQNVTITADFTSDGVTVSDSYTITVTEAIKRPTSIAITGPTSVAEGSNTINLVATVTYDDATTSVVTTSGSWLSDNTAVATVGASDGIVTSASSVVGDQTVNISVSYTEAGETVNDSVAITVTEGALTPVSVAITGPTTVAEGGNTVNLVATVTYDDSSTAVVTTSGTWSSTNTSAATVGASDGVVTSANNIVGDQATDINFEYTENGTTVNAPVHSMTVTEGIIRPVSVAITGPTSAPENGTDVNFVATVTYDDSSTAVVTTSANGTWTSSNTAALTIGAQTGVGTPATSVVGNTNTNINYEYTENGVTVNAPAHAFTTTEAINRPVSVAITGPASVDEGSNTINLVATVTYEDTTTAVVTTSGAWTSDNTAAATVGASDGIVTSAATVTGDQIANISFEYTEGDTTVNDSYAVTVTEAAKTPVSITITGPTTINEGNNTANLTATVTYDDSTTANVTTSGSWATSDAGAATVGINTGVVTSANDIVGNQPVTISVSYTENGTTVNDDHAMTVQDTIKRPTSVAITGPTTVNEGGNTINLVATVTYDDSTTAVVTTSANGTWGSSNNSVATVGANNGVVTSASNIVGNQSVNINYSYTENGETVNAVAHGVTIVEAILRPTSLAITGPITVAEGGNTINLTAIVTYEDSSTASVTTSASWSSTNNVVATVGAATGIVTSANNVIGDQAVTINASYTEAGETVNASHAITVTEAIKRPTSVAITGPTSLDEGGNTINLVATVTYDDSTTSVVTTSGSWSSSNTGAATIGASTGVVTSAADVASNTVVTMTFSYTENGETVNDTHDVTVNDVAPAATPLARYGYAPFAGPTLTEAGHADSTAFMNAVGTNIMPSNNDGEGVTADTSFQADGTLYMYFMWPKDLGNVTIFNVGFGAPEDWIYTKEAVAYSFDGSDPTPIEITYDDGSGARQWYILRNDFPGAYDSSTIDYTFSYDGN